MMITAKEARFLAHYGELNPVVYGEIDESIRSAAAGGAFHAYWCGAMTKEMIACLNGEGFTVTRDMEDIWIIDWNPRIPAVYLARGTETRQTEPKEDE